MTNSPACGSAGFNADDVAFLLHEAAGYRSSAIDPCVVYRSEENGSVWARPLDVFTQRFSFVAEAPALQAGAQVDDGLLEDLVEAIWVAGRNYQEGRKTTELRAEALKRRSEAHHELRAYIDAVAAPKPPAFEAARHGERCGVCGNSACECLPSEKDLAHGTQEEE